MKVQYMQTQIMNGQIVYKIEGEVPKKFCNIDEAAKWIEGWLDDKESFVRRSGFDYDRNGNILKWTAMGIAFIEVLDVTV